MVLKVARLIRDNLDTWKGMAALYHLDPPANDPACGMRKAGLCVRCVEIPVQYLVISSVSPACGSDVHETKAFSGDEAGNVCMATFDVIPDMEDHEALLKKMGYSLIRGDN